MERKDSTRSIVEQDRRVCKRVNGKRVVERWQGSEVDLSCRDRRGRLPGELRVNCLDLIKRRKVTCVTFVRLAGK